jgi:hypothetical protein
MHAARVGIALDSGDDTKSGSVDYKGLVFDEPLRFDLLADDCLLVELKAVEILHSSSKAQLFSYMKLLDIPIGLLINFHEVILKNGISRMILPGANQTAADGKDISLQILGTNSFQQGTTFVRFVTFCKRIISARVRQRSVRSGDHYAADPRTATILVDRS